MDFQMNDLLQMIDILQSGGFNPKDTHGQKLSPLAFLEAFMPYLPPQQQQTVGRLIQLNTLQQTLMAYVDNAVNRRSSQNGDWRLELLSSIRPHLPYPKQRMIDLIIKMMEVNEIMDDMNRKDGMCYGA